MEPHLRQSRFLEMLPVDVALGRKQNAVAEKRRSTTVKNDLPMEEKEKRPVKIDHRTTIFVAPTKTDEEAINEYFLKRRLALQKYDAQSTSRGWAP